MHRTPCVGTVAVAAAVVLLGTGAVAGAVRVERRPIVELTVRPLSAPFAPGEDDRPRVLEIEPGGTGETRFTVAWPEADDRTRVHLQAAVADASVAASRRVELRATVEPPGGGTVDASREADFDDRGTILFEAYRVSGRSLTLVIEAAEHVRTVVAPPPTVGAAVRFRIEVLRVIDGRAIPLEENVLQTFVGQPVSYSFRLGETPEADSARLTLEPRRLVGEVLEVDVGLTGKVPVGDSMEAVARTEHWLASHDATSTLAIESGDPPTGWRFRVTARIGSGTSAPGS